MNRFPYFPARGVACGVGRLLALVLASSPAHAQLDSLLAPVNPAALPSPAGANAATPPSVPDVLNAEMLRAELEKELQARLSLNGELRIEVTNAWQPIKLPAPEFAIQLTEMPIGGIGSTFFVRAKIVSGTSSFGPFQIAVRAQLWQEVWMAANRLDRGQALDRSVLAAQKVDVLHERQQMISTDVDPATLELTMNLNAGRPLTKREAVSRPVVRKGQVVQVVAQQGTLTVSMKAIALENGATGDLIRLRNLDSRKDFNAQVINETKVQVHF